MNNPLAIVIATGLWLGVMLNIESRWSMIGWTIVLACMFLGVRLLGFANAVIGQWIASAQLAADREKAEMRKEGRVVLKADEMLVQADEHGRTIEKAVNNTLLPHMPAVEDVKPALVINNRGVTCITQGDDRIELPMKQWDALPKDLRNDIHTGRVSARQVLPSPDDKQIACGQPAESGFPAVSRMVSGVVRTVSGKAEISWKDRGSVHTKVIVLAEWAPIYAKAAQFIDAGSTQKGHEAMRMAGARGANGKLLAIYNELKRRA